MYVKQLRVAGIPDAQLTLLPYAIQTDKNENVQLHSGHGSRRSKLRLPEDKRIIISVGAVNAHHKRMDYVVHEFSRLAPKEYFLLIVGQLDQLSEGVLALAKMKLRFDSYQILQLGQEDMKDYLFDSDYCILASLHEGLPRVLLEALGAGLLPILHDSSVTRDAMNEYGFLAT